MSDLDGIKKVLAGESAIGKLSQYFLDTRSFNLKHGIEDDTGYGETNGYGTVCRIKIGPSQRLHHLVFRTRRLRDPETQI